MTEKNSGVVDIYDLIKKNSKVEKADRKNGPPTTVRTVTRSGFYDIMEKGFQIPESELKKMNDALVKFDNAFVKITADDLKEKIEEAKDNKANDLTNFRSESKYGNSHMTMHVTVVPQKEYPNPQVPGGDSLVKHGVVSIKGTLVKSNMSDTLQQISASFETMLS